MVLQIFSWMAVAVLGVSFWFQIWKIHIHREVRDISVVYYALLAIGYAILTGTAYVEGSWIFFVKQIMTLVPSVVIIGQVYYHRGDEWHDERSIICSKCSREIDGRDRFCSKCGSPTETF